MSVVLTAPQRPTDRPDLWQSHWQGIGRYIVRWVWAPGATTWRADRILLREISEKRFDALIDRRRMVEWERDGLPAEVEAWAREVAERHGLAS